MLDEFGCDASSFAGVIEGCSLRRVWCGRAAEGGQVALGSSRSSAGQSEEGIVVKIHLDTTITTEHLYR